METHLVIACRVMRKSEAAVSMLQRTSTRRIWTTGSPVDFQSERRNTTLYVRDALRAARQARPT